MTDTATPETSDPAADLALIRRMMHEGRQAATVDGTHLLIWGTLLGLGFLGQFVVITRGHGGASATVWAPVILIGWVLSFWLGYRQALCYRLPGRRYRDDAIFHHRPSG